MLLLVGAPQRATVPQFQLTDTTGRMHASTEWAEKRAVVLVFVSTDCPLSTGYAPELNRIEQSYAPRGVGFYAVQGDATVKADEVRRHVKEFGYTFVDLRNALDAVLNGRPVPHARTKALGCAIIRKD